jgi:hypothetical protein
MAEPQDGGRPHLQTARTVCFDGGVSTSAFRAADPTGDRMKVQFLAIALPLIEVKLAGNQFGLTPSEI